MINFAVCIFLSAFLLFQIQPIISKTLLPWFGGTQAVWSSAMLFFEIALTGGYAYANWLVNRKKTQKQTIIHLILLGISVCLVIYLWIIWPSPITPAGSWRPDNSASPILYIFLLLTISVGLPFFVLSTNSPLMQAWFSRKNPGRSPYWLYALSNVGSLLGLILYPILIEPNLTIQWQGWVWASGYLLFVLIAGYNATLPMKSIQTPTVVENDPTTEDRQDPKKGYTSPVDPIECTCIPHDVGCDQRNHPGGGGYPIPVGHSFSHLPGFICPGILEQALVSPRISTQSCF